MREYPPAHFIHEAGCQEAPHGLLAFKAHNLRGWPNSRPHTCFTLDTVTFDREVVAEPGEYEPHVYEPSTIRPPDAPRALCKTCRGTHSEQPVDLPQFLGIA